MTKWTEVNVYTGRPVDEDAPTNFGGAGSGVDMNPTGMKKKKKRLIDARYKSYKSHRAKLEAARVKREAKRNSVQEHKGTEPHKHPHEDDEIDEGKYLKYSDLLLQKSRLVDKHGPESKEVQAVNKELSKEKKKLGIKEEVELDEKKPDEMIFHFRSFNDAKKFNDYVYKHYGNMFQVIHFEKGRDVYASSVSVRPKDGVKLAPYETLYKELDKIAKKFKSVKSIKHLQNSENYDVGTNEYTKTFSEKVIESVSEFNVESLLAEDNVDVLRSIVKNKAMKPIKLKDGIMKVDLFTASAIIQVLDKVKPANKTKLTKMLNGKKSDFMRASEGIMKMIGKR
jgi:hypothetical protein